MDLIILHKNKNENYFYFLNCIPDNMTQLKKLTGILSHKYDIFAYDESDVQALAIHRDRINNAGGMRAIYNTYFDRLPSDLQIMYSELKDEAKLLTYCENSKFPIYWNEFYEKFSDFSGQDEHDNHRFNQIIEEYVNQNNNGKFQLIRDPFNDLTTKWSNMSAWCNVCREHIDNFEQFDLFTGSHIHIPGLNMSRQFQVLDHLIEKIEILQRYTNSIELHNGRNFDPLHVIRTIPNEDNPTGDAYLTFWNLYNDTYKNYNCGINLFVPIDG